MATLPARVTTLRNPGSLRSCTYRSKCHAMKRAGPVEPDLGRLDLGQIPDMRTTL